MKLPNPSNKQAAVSFLGALAIGAGVLALTANQASATLTFDLRATTISNDPTGLATVDGPKSVSGLTPGSVITFDVWFQITTLAGTGSFGHQAVVFDALSNNGGSLLGNFSPFTPIAPWDVSSVAGNPTDLDGDTDLDLGTNTTNSTTGSPKPRAASHLTTVTNPALFSPVNLPGIGSGFEFKVGTLTFTVTAPGLDQNTPLGLDLRAHASIMSSGALKNGAAIFTEGGTVMSGSTGTFRSGGAVQLIAVPEPSAFGMVILGAMGLVGFRRLGLRRS